ncbi:PREDICTED: carboxyl-terminal-processing peptidase 3, chloroplastic-like isoform X1 [Brassica oleracea var. oleracea]|uniref:carboxyl-terminal-processing peptidase 3, chloroplastic-like isoform X1 n=1 Tax=Brassica oleracea var. oleracea TaxID=109376 RepID=UPI0006A73990|nr:PREDICTED: carboxyl-terminal-processing peptidase 3, chloroplastic-like isoform X1 [Brassica oleracea var. oleracea]
MNNTVGRKLLGLAAAAAIAVSSSICCDSTALAESITIAFPVSRAREVTAVQRTLVEAWGLIRETFVDPTFNHQANDGIDVSFKISRCCLWKDQSYALYSW